MIWRKTTKKVLERLHAVNPGSYRVDAAELTEDSEVIHLHGDYVLVVDEDASLPTVSLDELLKAGGNVAITSWVVDNDVVLDEVITAALKCSKA